jgi:GNAT superfamily N-acetyltransferase
LLKIFQVENDKDLEQVRILFEEYPKSLDFDLSFQNFAEEIANLPGEYVPPKGCLLLATYNGNLAGCAGLRELDDGVCEMKRLYVRQEFRGFKIGRALANAVIEQAKQMGYKRMRLDTAMNVAKKLYLAMGFKEIEPYEYNPVKGAMFMELKLE